MCNRLNFYFLPLKGNIFYAFYWAGTYTRGVFIIYISKDNGYTQSKCFFFFKN